jgi:hypothetical protein
MKVVDKKLYHWENIFVLKNSYRDIISKYTQFLFLEGSQIGKALFLESNNYENYEDGKPFYM